MDRTFKREKRTTTANAPANGRFKRQYEDLEIKGIREELERARYNERFWVTLFLIVGSILVAAALVVLLTSKVVPVVRMQDDQMNPTLSKGQLLITKKKGEYKAGDVIAFYQNRGVLVRRVIACEGDWVSIADDGTVFVNDVAINEPYITEKAMGNCSYKLPCQVAKGSFFVMSDHRSEDYDSRDASVGCVSEGQIIGRVSLGMWPFSKVN